MSLALINRDQGGGSDAGSTIATPSRAHTAGNLLVAMFSWQISSFTSIADTAGNTWHDTGINFTGGNNIMRIYYAYNISGNASNVVTVTLSGGGTYRTIVVYEISGAGTSDPLNTTSTGTDTTGTSITTATLTISATSEIICALVVGSPTITGGSGYTLVNFGLTGSDPTAYFADEYHIISASEAATASNGSSAFWCVAAASFKVASVSSSKLLKPNTLRPAIFSPGIAR